MSGLTISISIFPQEKSSSPFTLLRIFFARFKNYCKKSAYTPNVPCFNGNDCAFAHGRGRQRGADPIGGRGRLVLSLFGTWPCWHSPSCWDLLVLPRSPPQAGVYGKTGRNWWVFFFPPSLSKTRDGVVFCHPLLLFLNQFIQINLRITATYRIKMFWFATWCCTAYSLVNRDTTETQRGMGRASFLQIRFTHEKFV